MRFIFTGDHRWGRRGIPKKRGSRVYNSAWATGSYKSLMNPRISVAFTIANSPLRVHLPQINQSLARGISSPEFLHPHTPNSWKLVNGIVRLSTCRRITAAIPLLRLFDKVH
jgi:hypothetical protein